MTTWRVWVAGWLMAWGVAAFAAESVDKHEVSRIRTQLAIEYAKFGNMSAALDNARQAVAADEASVDARLAMAYIQTLLQQDADAEQSYQKALQLAPDSPEANNNYGLFLCEHSRAEQGLAYFNRALANPLYNSRQTAYLNLGRCSAIAGARDKANEYLLSALRAAPQFVPALMELARLQLEGDNARLAAFYFDRARKAGAQMQAGDLWLGVRIARKNGDAAHEAEYASELKARYPDSKETQQLFGGS